MLVCVCICLTLVLSTLTMSGVQFVDAANVRNELWLVAGCNTALVNNNKQLLSEEYDLSPYKYETGTLYLPLSIAASYAGATYEINGSECEITLANGSVAVITVDSAEWTLDGAQMTDFLLPVAERYGMPFISILMSKDLFGYYNYYDHSMGLVIISKSSVSGYNTGYSSLKSQISTASKMILDKPSSSVLYSDIEENGGADSHPKLLIDGDQFSALRSVYNNGAPDDPYTKGIKNQVTSALNSFNIYFDFDLDGSVKWKNEEAQIKVRQPYYLYDENGNRLVGQTTYTYVDENGESVTLTLEGGNKYGDGYDVGGRSNVGKFTSILQRFAFAWQITGEDKYADAFYLLALELDKWEHWGEGHFLNVADGSYSYAIGYDWIYHAFDDEPEKLAEMADILYRKGVMKGYYSVRYDSTAYRQADMHVSKVVGNGGMRTTNRENNWQTVCGAGMITSALAILEFEEYRDNCLYVITGYMGSLEKCLVQYAPDGAYPESASYWAYGTNSLMNTLAALTGACGDSYGYEDIIGLYDSYYYAAGIASSDYQMWNYHDAARSDMDFSYFYLAAQVFEDPNLAAFRNTMIYEREWKMTLMDVLFYDPDLDASDAQMPLDNNYKGIHTATFRSSWDEGATFTGLHAGASNVTHGDFDTGNFILSMGGVEWCIDPGTEDYNTPGFWDTSLGGTRYRLYRKSLEGHNTIVIQSSELTHGQTYVGSTGSFPTIDKNNFYSDENGGYARTNMTGQYGSTCTSGYRGVLLTNSRKTVVLQDEISFSTPTSLTWVLNLVGYIQIINDGKTIITTYSVNNVKKTLRLTLLSDDNSLKFEKAKANETVLNNTITKSNSGIYGTCNPEARVFIRGNDVTEFNVSVVFELLDFEEQVVGYSAVPMSEWTTTDSEWLDNANADLIPEEKPVYKYNASHFAYALAQFKAAGDDWKKYQEIIADTIIYLSSYDPNDANIAKMVRDYDLYLSVYNLYVQEVNKEFSNAFVAVMPKKDSLT